MSAGVLCTIEKSRLSSAEWKALEEKAEDMSGIRQVVFTPGGFSSLSGLAGLNYRLILYIMNEYGNGDFYWKYE